MNNINNTMKKYLILILPLFSGCMSVNYTTLIPETNFELKFVNFNMEPMSGITSSCISTGGKAYLSNEIANELNENPAESNEQGTLNIRHKQHRDGGSYYYFGKFQWGQKPLYEVACSFYKNGIVVNTSSTKLFKNNETTVIKIENI